MTVNDLLKACTDLSVLGHGDKPVKVEVLTNQTAADPRHNYCEYDYDDVCGLTAGATAVILDV